ncbi:toxin-antitoxin system YwqK family antitoxin [Streptomyces sp. NPDC039016]|uniref:toxin-antitoxin system YwqK family antitoxin n=1 Tax=Streptomyces sp. NPDC039016 TaxID=3154330 RepID=UPI0033DAC3E3
MSTGRSAHHAPGTPETFELVAYEDCYRDEDARLHYEDDPFTGDVFARDPQGRVISLASYVDGVPSGPQTQWYPDGTKKKEGQARYGIAVGDWRRWHPNGQLAEHTVFSLHGCHERLREWDEDGNPTVDESHP